MVQTSADTSLLAQRDLLAAWTFRIVRARYQQSILGGLWAIVQPVATVAIFTVIFTRFIPIDTGTIPYVVFAYTAMLPWTLFATGLTDMVNSLVESMNLVTKIYFPRAILPLAALLARLVDFAIASLVLVGLMVAFDIPLFAGSWLFLPLILAIQLALMVGLGLAGAALNVFFRDIKHLIVLGLQLWLYASPIIYPVARVPEGWRGLYFLNPMAGIIESYRAVLLHGQPPGSELLTAALVAGVVAVAGALFFARVEFQFADVV